MNNVVDAVIEIPLKTKNKFEIDKKSNRIKLDRVLYSAMSYPAEYGYIENTLANDGDPLDILVISSEPTFPGCIVPARVIGYLSVIDNGHEDYKLILNSDYSLSLFDIKNNKELKKIPQNLPEDLKEEVTKLRKEIPSFMKNTSSLLAVLLSSGEKYSYDLFKEIFIDNAIMNRFASSLIWNLYDKDDNFVTTFRYSSDGSYSNCEDEEVKIDDNSFVSLASPIEMDDETINKWRKQLEDYEIAQPLQQLTIIKLDKDNLKSELEKIDNSEIAYGTFKAFGARYGMYTEYIGYDVVSSYSLKSKNGDTFSIYANVNSKTDFHDRVKIDIYFTNENGEEVSKRFIYTLLVLMILDFRLTDLF